MEKILIEGRISRETKKVLKNLTKFIVMCIIEYELFLFINLINKMMFNKMMFGLNLKAFYVEDAEKSWEAKEQSAESGSTAKELEEFKDMMKTIETSGNVQQQVLNKVSKKDLADFISDKFFSDEDFSYVKFIKKSPKTLNLCMKQALKLISEGDETKYDDQWNQSDNWKTAEDWLSQKWFNLERDTTLIKILQNKVWAVVDWKPWPQTVALVISRLWWNISGFYDKINSNYGKTPDLKIWNIQTYTYASNEFKYDTNVFYIRGATDGTPRIVDADKKDDKDEEWVEIKVVDDDNGNKKLEAEGFVFEDWWLKKAPKSSEWWTQNEEENDPLKGLKEEEDYTEETGDLIKKYGKRFTLTKDNQKEYIGVLNSIMNNSDKKWGLKSLLALNDEFWGSYKIDLDWLKILEQKLDSWDLDWTADTFEIVDDEDEYVTIEWGQLIEIKKNKESIHKPVFEANGTSRWDDYRFDSVEAFMKFIGWKKPIKASEHVKNLSKTWDLKDLLEKEEYKNYKNRFSDELLKKSAELNFTWERYETFLSLLALGDNFWKGYKLTVKDIKNFKRWMDKDIFDYRSGSSTVFHAKWLKFEVDWTGYLSDDTFASVAEFFNYLGDKV